MASHSVRVEPQAIHKVQQALARQNLKQNSLAELTGLDSLTLNRFFRGELVRFTAIAAIYSALELTWEEGDTLALFTQTSKSPFNSRQRHLEILIERSRERCCAKIQSTYSKIRLLDGRWLEAERVSPSVYTLDKLPLDTYHSRSDLLQQFNAIRNFDRFGLGERQGRIPGIDAATLCDKLFVVGKPGIGKTSFLRYLAMACCNGNFQRRSIPILLELKALTDAEGTSPTCVQDWIYRELAEGDRDLAENLLHHGCVLILCDELDEIPEPARRSVQYQLRTFSQRYFKNRFVLASKTQFVEYPFPAFEWVEIAEFSLEQIRKFVDIWFADFSDSPAQIHALTRQFFYQLCKPENWRIAELVGHPFNLSLACWLSIAYNSLPAYPCDLFDQGLRLFWHAQSQQDEAPPSKSERLALLSHLALRTCDRGELLFDRKKLFADSVAFLQATSSKSIPLPQLEARAQSLLLHLEKRDRLLSERDRGIYSFSSVELHQYFLGRALVTRLKLQDFEGTFSRSTPKLWCDSFFDSLNRFPSADDLLLHLKRKTDEILAREPKLQIFLGWVQRKATSVATSYKPAAVRAFYLSLGIDRDLEPKLANPLDFSHAVDRSVKSPLHNRSLACWLDANVAIAFRHDPLRQLDPDLALDLILDCLLVTSTHDLGFFLTFLEDRNLQLDENFSESLHELNQQLPDLRTHPQKYEAWWEARSHDWIESLRFAIIGYRNIGYVWQLDSREQELLEQYLNAHKYLIEGLNRATNVSSQLQYNLEETLLLPALLPPQIRSSSS
ncbi:NACHT domain-containing protein [Oscillatoria sp. FACHB-1406]|uniref:NACHT domain-containing protein n=1 Tax=Oscillatoria sp. FACHB-1406 TaxID=2692846 RepID=UPI001683ED8F|nr:NACHT domain-containing protein [Oscillatoria sp. FACHB-1406]MBD2580531.1 NACHT domain-containing protein [Oscillatoria sp. FACHB-1406]